MTWDCTVGRIALENRISKLAATNPGSSQDILAVLDFMKNLFDSLSEIFVQAAQNQQSIEQAIQAQTIAIVGAANYQNTFNNMTPAQFAVHLQQHFNAIGVQPPSWGEVAEIACDSLLTLTNDPDGKIREAIKRSLITKI
ncbi:hypothetical protein [Paraburkholderia caffeinilytica]|uniref:hypothetical protein n=1 Tax=Paraburkholderia caffeinilytica TaxID=1761016 RepID=UPI003DA06F30